VIAETVRKDKEVTNTCRKKDIQAFRKNRKQDERTSQNSGIQKWKQK
jgi:hypothetical protein